jgi:transforming growth factor-beta-induced protein
MKKTLILLASGLIGFGASIATAEKVSIAETAAYMPEKFSTLTAALVKTDLAQVLNNDGDFTVFAPTNAAFDAASTTGNGLDLVKTLDKETLTDILLYHVVPGKFGSDDIAEGASLTTVNGNDITRVGNAIEDGQGNLRNLVLSLIDIEANNGIIHVIDGVLLPPTEEEPKNIVELAVGTPELSTLVAAVVKAGFVDLLSNDRYEFTVFAPVNSAFDTVAEDVLGTGATGPQLVEYLSAWELRKILLNHVLYGERDSEYILDRRWFFTLGWSWLSRTGFTLSSRNGSGTLVDGLIDVDATNGIVHVVDGVLLP